MRIMWIACVVIACGNSKDAPPATGSATPPPVANTAIDAAVVVASPDAPHPSLPSLGAPPAGMDAAKAKACDAGDAAGCVAAANSYAPHGAYRAELPKAEADARAQGTARFAMRGCDLGNGEGCALAAQFGDYINVDKLLARACELDHVASCGSIGTRRFPGAEGKVEQQQATALMEKACVADAVDWIALTSHHGGFCQKLFDAYMSMNDKPRAAHFLKLACNQGDKHHCPCKVDDDCGKLPEDEGGLGYFCASGHCEIASSD